MRLRTLTRLGCVCGWLIALPVTASTELIGAEVHFHGRVVSQPCNVDPQSADQRVDIGTVIVKDIYRHGHTAPVPFNIKLTDCKTAVFKSLNVTFTGVEDTELSGRLAINNGNNGVAIALFDTHGASIMLNQPSSSVVLQNGPNVLDFSSYVIGRPGAIQNRTITEGSFQTVANFTLAYQ